MPRKFTYHWLYIPTGVRGVGTTYRSFSFRLDFMDLLNEWNCASPTFWKYWSTD